MLHFKLFITILMLPLSKSIITNKNIFRQIAYKFSSNHIQPIKRDRLKYIIDIDGTICTKTKSDYSNCKPIKENIDYFNNLYFSGNEIHYWSSRGAISGKNWDELTIKQLESWGVYYNTINMGKPHYDVWIDDKAHNVRQFCNN